MTESLTKVAYGAGARPALVQAPFARHHPVNASHGARRNYDRSTDRFSDRFLVRVGGSTMAEAIAPNAFWLAGIGASAIAMPFELRPEGAGTGWVAPVL